MIVHRPAHRRPPSRSGFLLTVLAAAALVPGSILALTIRAAVPAGAAPAAMTASIAAPAPELPYHRVIRPVLAAQPAVAAARTYTVRAGDYLSGIALRLCSHANDWTGIYAANRAVIGGNPNLIFPGQVYVITRCTDPPALLRLAVQPPARSDSDGEDGGSVTTASSPAGHSTYSGTYSGTYHGSTAMQQCIIARESGGDSQVMNSTGHYGLYQFSLSTWVESGGSAASFGHASITEQNKVFYNAVSARGYSDWTPYDGC